MNKEAIADLNTMNVADFWATYSHRITSEKPGSDVRERTSLYDSLYHDDLIPHTAGLKPGSRINPARQDRVVRFGREYLDTAFPLKDGSHRDAVSYMVYFQNLLVILADGSTTGLQMPKQYQGKDGPADAPDSIYLSDNDLKVEISFDQCGSKGAIDLASIEDIQIVAN